MAVRPQAITGVSAGGEQLLRSVYPSICSAALGRLIGQLMDAVPVGVGNIKLSFLLAPLLGPLAAVGYFAEKILGEKYVLTNRSVQRWKAFGLRRLQEMPLADIREIAVEVQPGQEFYKAGDLLLMNAAGNVVMKLSGVPRPEIFRETIVKARDARTQVEESLTRIRARQTG